MLEVVLERGVPPLRQYSFKPFKDVFILAVATKSVIFVSVVDSPLGIVVQVVSNMPKYTTYGWSPRNCTQPHGFMAAVRKDSLPSLAKLPPLLRPRHCQKSRAPRPHYLALGQSELQAGLGQRGNVKRDRAHPRRVQAPY